MDLSRLQVQSSAMAGIDFDNAKSSELSDKYAASSD